MKEYTKLFFKGLRGGLFFATLFMSTLYAQNQPPVGVELVPGGNSGKHVFAGLVLTIPADWHVYAPSPQNEDTAGFDPKITWDESSNLQSAKVLWPVAKKTELQGLLSYVYEGKTLIPLELTPQDKNKPITLKLKVSFLACSSLCMPFEQTLSILLKPGVKEHAVFEAMQKREDAYEGLSLWSLLAIALLGGLILNIMPCVLPVLSLKIMSLVKQSKKKHSHQAKQGFFITGLGIIFSFLILALVTVLLKESGQAFGWGIHFQNPHFLLFVFLVLVAFSASLCGVFEIDLPSGLGSWIVDHEGKGTIKDFLSGVFATLLATPCSAPFVGTALSFALARNTGDIFLVFFCLGLGFASPYFLVASLPQRYIILPKPGVWMIYVQTVLGGLLALTALWIGWILTFHLPLWVVLLSTFLALVALSLFWLKHHKIPTLKAWAFAAPLFLAAWALSWVGSAEMEKERAQETPPAISVTELWQPFDPEAIQKHVAEGKFVFVDVTAEWCVTCAVNKKLVMNDPQILAILTAPNVIAMRADWTKQDAHITEFLQSYGRYGIPFNVIFGPQNPTGIPLPEILSVDSVQEGFKKAGLPQEQEDSE
jgi:suppressor for copper-sensitivity B